MAAWLFLHLLSALGALAPAARQDVTFPAEVESEVRAVTLYVSGASVTRAAELPAGGGRFLVRGLPAAIDRDALRVRAAGAEVIGVELKERIAKDAPEPRVVELEARVRALEDELAALLDEDAVLERAERHIGGLFRAEESARAAALRRGEADSEAWKERLDWLAARASDTRTLRRELGWRVADTRVALADAQAELGKRAGRDGAHVLDALIELADSSGAPVQLELEYLVSEAGWRPAYELRAPKDLKGIELVFRASAWQESGEDWRDADVYLSTAVPQRGARGPEAPAVWLDLKRGRLGELGYAGDDEQAKDFISRRAGTKIGVGSDLAAEVLDEGLTVRYQLARRETIESGKLTTVLVGRASLSVAPEHVCTPALDTTAWLRARAKNTSEWVLVPGRAAVYFGADFLGHAHLPAAQRGEEILLDLGPDPGVLVERVLLEDVTEKAGIFESRSTLRRSWRIRIRNHGAFTAAADGSVALVLQEPVPRASDERVEVDIERAEPDPAKGERWKKLWDEKGLLAWLVSVPRGGERTVELAVEISYPQDLELVFR